MVKRFNIVFKKPEVNEDQRNAIMRAFLNDERNQEINLVFLMISSKQPASISEITKAMNLHYNQMKVFSVQRIKYYTNKLLERNLLNERSANDAYNSRDSEFSEEILNKYNESLSDVPPQFRGKFGYMQFYKVSIFGEQFVEWSAKCAGFEIKGGEK